MRAKAERHGTAVAPAWSADRRLRARLGCLTLTGILCAVVPAPARSEIGRVLEIRGDWYLYADAGSDATAQKLSKWDAVPANGVIRIRSPHPSDHITIVDANTKILETRKCANTSDCNRPLFLPRQSSSKDSEISAELGAILDRVWTALWGESHKRSLHRARVVVPISIFAEGVAPLVGGRVDLRSVMQHVPRGTYSLRRHVVPDGNDAPRQTVFDWDPDHPAPVSVDQETPGLYDIDSAMGPGGQLPGAGVSIRVLLCSPPGCRNAEDAFQKIRAMTAQWGDAATPDTVHAFLRSYLAELAKGDGPASKGP